MQKKRIGKNNSENIAKGKYKICIYCYYNANGHVSKDVSILCSELHRIADFLIVVVNGRLYTDEVSEFHADEIVFRDNRGWDAGAYKKVLFDERYQKIIKKSSELILCNNSFWGPFIRLKDIWDKMDESNVDFWGLSGSKFDLIQHIQSYFLVFRKSILENEVFWNYFEKHIDEEETDYFLICAGFENGLYHELISHGFKGDAYVKRIRCETYRNPLGSIMLDRLPILKKKVFSPAFLNEQIWNAVLEIDKIYDYPISVILDVAKELYGVTSPQEISDVKFRVACDLRESDDLIKREDVAQFIAAHDRIYIYGTGFYACYIFSAFFYYRNNPKLSGFLESKIEGEKECYGYPVCQYERGMFRQGIGIIMAVSAEHTREIMENIDGEGDILCLWKNGEKINRD